MRARISRLLPPATKLAAVAVLLVVAGPDASIEAAHAQSEARQPAQPKSGPGGRDYSHRGVRVSAGGEGADAWYVFQPSRPRPKRAPLAVVMHGYGEYSGYASMEALIRHTVRKGTVVIYPRWQTDLVTPCPGPFDIEPCMASAVNGIKGGIAHLRTSRNRVQPQLTRTSYFGFSFGGIITTNLANRYKALGLPKPRAVFLDDPHDGGVTGRDEPALDDDLGGIPSSTLFQCHTGERSVNGYLAGEPRSGESCNAVFPELTTIPARNKDLVLTQDDDHGTPTLSSAHGVCAAGNTPEPGHGAANAYDWNFCWKVWDAMRSCALARKDCRYALGDTREHRSLGRWSDGTPVAPLKIQDAAPIRP